MEDYRMHRMLWLIAALAGAACLAGGCDVPGSPPGGPAPVMSPLPTNRVASSTADPARGRAVFGIAADGVGPDATLALFSGFSQKAGRTIGTNGRTCFSCHRPEANFMLNPLLPLARHLRSDDPLIRPDAVVADSGGHPDAARLLDAFGLILIRPHRFAGLRADDPRGHAFGWRKVPTTFNVAFANGFLADLRMNVLTGADTGAAMSHTQDHDKPFDDIIDPRMMEDLAAFQFTLFAPPELSALADGPVNPDFARLAADPFSSVPVRNEQERRGRDVFRASCLPCHDTPNVFGNATRRRDANDAPMGQGFNIGVAEANMLGLDFRRFDPATGARGVVELPLVDPRGETVTMPLRQDPGLALITGKLEDRGKFKVPQLRNLRRSAPYFHDCSAPDLRAVIDYFNSAFYNTSPDGRRFPISLDRRQANDLHAFLLLL
jgi:hypothetical protein